MALFRLRKNPFGQFIIAEVRQQERENSATTRNGLFIL
jgi:hypothetical protein